MIITTRRSRGALLPLLLLFLPACTSPRMRATDAYSGRTESRAPWTETEVARLGSSSAIGTPPTGTPPTGTPPTGTPPTGSQADDYSAEGMFQKAHAKFLNSATRYRPNFQFAGLLQTDTGLSDEVGEFRLTQFDLRGAAPIYLDPDFMLRIGGEYQQRIYNFDGNVAGASNEQLHKIGAIIGATFFPEDDIRVDLDLRPGVYSDLQSSIETSDWNLFFSALGTYRFQEDMYLKVGFENSERFRDVKAYPLIGIGWRLSEKWRVDAVLPRRAEISYEIDDAAIVWSALDIQGEEFRRHAGGGESDVHVQEFRLELGGLYRVSDMLSVYGSFGLTLAGDYNWVDGAGNTFSGQVLREPFFQIGMGLDF